MGRVERSLVWEAGSLGRTVRLWFLLLPAFLAACLLNFPTCNLTSLAPFPIYWVGNALPLLPTHHSAPLLSLPPPST